jgi:hypothetical protein
MHFRWNKYYSGSFLIAACVGHRADRDAIERKDIAILFIHSGRLNIPSTLVVLVA